MTSSKIIVIVPAFNEEKTIGEVVENLKGQAQEIIVVNDGSADNTASKARAAGAVVINNEKNQGYDASIQKGFQEAMRRGADILVTCDADGQHGALDVHRLTELIIKNEADVAIGQRQEVIHTAEKILAFYTKHRFGIPDPLCGLKAYHRKVYEAIGHFDTIGSIGTQLSIEAVTKGFRLANVPITTNERQDASRFYIKILRANYKILRAMIRLMLLKKS